MKSTGRSLKPVLGITLVLALLFGLFLPSLVVLEFHMNRAEIIRTKCVQRALPEERNCCKGSCHLKKELKKVEASTEDEPQAPRIESVELLATLPSVCAIGIRPVMERTYPGVIAQASSGHCPAVDHIPWLG